MPDKEQIREVRSVVANIIREYLTDPNTPNYFTHMETLTGSLPEFCRKVAHGILQYEYLTISIVQIMAVHRELSPQVFTREKEEEISQRLVALIRTELEKEVQKAFEDAPLRN